jgi:hypothetical protein
VNNVSRYNGSEMVINLNGSFAVYIKGIIDRILKKHWRVKKHFFNNGRFKDKNGIQRDLMNYDKDITEKIVIRMLSMGCGVFPIHDSYVVPWKYRKELEQTMMDVYMNYPPLKASGIVPVIKPKFDNSPTFDRIELNKIENTEVVQEGYSAFFE